MASKKSAPKVLNALQILGRESALFDQDVESCEAEIRDALSKARVLVFGGAGSIGKEVVGQIFRRNPAALHVIDLSENNLVELVRDLRSSIGYTSGETLFMPLDMGGLETQAFLSTQRPYDYVLNLAAMKHVRSEKDAFSLMRMVKTNILDTLSTLEAANATGAKKYFAVSSDKAKNPANLMGATKRIMEDVLFRSRDCAVSTARFANVAFSDGSLLFGFRHRMLLRQPISAPSDVKRYFITPWESGLLCLLSVLRGQTREIFFPKLEGELELVTFSEIAVRFLAANGYEAVPLASEEEARERAEELIGQRKWPCYFFESDTSGEKPFEEFYSEDDHIAWDRFKDIGVIRTPLVAGPAEARVSDFLATVAAFRKNGNWRKDDLTRAIQDACPELDHVETGRSLDQKM